MHKLVLVGGLLAVLVACSNGGNAVITAAPSSAVGSPPPVGTTSQLSPSIGGTPSGAAVANFPYSFTPSAADPYGDALTFSVQNAPSWASFNSATGELTPMLERSRVSALVSATGLAVPRWRNSRSSSRITVKVVRVSRGRRRPSIPMTRPSPIWRGIASITAITRTR
jgi:hypothetical protein